jgi:preprotein translocase subunit SecB
MKLSPVQLLESYPVKLIVEQNPKYSTINSEDGDEIEVKFEHITNIVKSPTQSEGEARYFSMVGIRSFSENEEDLPYSYEIMIGGIFSIDFSAAPKDVRVDDMAARHSFTMLYGQAREWLCNMTTRMRHGMVTLPTMSFMDASFPETKKD